MLSAVIISICLSLGLAQPTSSPAGGLSALMFSYFDHLDTNHDGFIELDEARAVFTDSDIEGDHIVTKKEYEHDLHNKQLADLIFDFFDSDTKYGGTANDGVLEESLLEPYYREVDTDKDGKVSRAEYTSYGTTLAMRILFG